MKLKRPSTFSGEEQPNKPCLNQTKKDHLKLVELDLSNQFQAKDH